MNGSHTQGRFHLCSPAVTVFIDCVINSAGVAVVASHAWIRTISTDVECITSAIGIAVEVNTRTRTIRLDYIVHRAIVAVIAFASWLRSAAAQIVCVAGTIEVSIGKGSSAGAVALNEVVDCAWVVVVAGRTRLSARTQVIRIACAIVVCISECSRTSAVGEDEVV
jgi:hypothetical protein